VEQEQPGVSGTKVVAAIIVLAILGFALALGLWFREKGRLERGEPPSIQLNRPKQ
jgi:hypothetical protein